MKEGINNSTRVLREESNQCRSMGHHLLLLLISCCHKEPCCMSISYALPARCRFGHKHGNIWNIHWGKFCSLFCVGARREAPSLCSTRGTTAALKLPMRLPRMKFRCLYSQNSRIRLSVNQIGVPMDQILIPHLNWNRFLSCQKRLQDC